MTFQAKRFFDRSCALALPAALASCLLGLAAHGATSSPQSSERRAEEEIEFAKGLATEWQFIELAEKVLDDVVNSGQTSDKLEQELELARCEVYSSGARYERDEEKRQALFLKAINSYRDFVDENLTSVNRESAELDLIDLASVYGRDVGRQLESAVGEQAAELKANMSEVLNDAIFRTLDLIDSLKAEIDYARDDDRPYKALANERHKLMLNAAQMRLTLGRHSDLGEAQFEEAGRTLEELALDAGETSFWGLHAYLLLGSVYSAQGLWEDAVSFLEYVCQSAVPRDRDLRKRVFEGKSQSELDVHWNFIELGMDDLVSALANAGDTVEACNWGMHFLNIRDEYGFAVSANGHLSRLQVARVLMNSGGFVGGKQGEYEWFQKRDDMRKAGFKSARESRTATDLALIIAQDVNRENQNNILKVWAQQTISDLINRPGVQVAPDILFEAAQGDYFNQDYARAIPAFKRVLASLENKDQATRINVGPRALWHLGRCLTKLDRPLEAAMVYSSGLDSDWVGDPEYDVKNAKDFNNSMRVVKSRAGSDPTIDRLFVESEEAILKHNKDDAGDIVFKQAKQKYDAKDYELARAQFGDVPGDANNYEKALVYIAVCSHKLGDSNQALRELNAYLDDYLSDPVNQTTDTTRILRRTEARGLAVYYGGAIHFAQAERGEGSYEEAVKWLGTYHEDFPDQRDFAARALYITLRSNLALQRYDDAKATLDILLAEFPRHNYTGVGANKIYGVLEEDRNAAMEAGNKSRSEELLPRMAEMLKIYNDLAPKPQLSWMRKEAALWSELKNWPEAERVLRQATANFATGSIDEDEKALTHGVWPDLAHALLEQHQVAEAADILMQLVPTDENPDRKPSRSTASNFARAVCGWVEGQGSEIIEVPGVGDAESIERACKIIDTIANSTDRWECPWYGIKFDLAYGYYKWGSFDSSKLESAKRQLNQMRSDLGDNLEQMTPSCDGDDSLRQKYLWLLRKL